MSKEVLHFSQVITGSCNDVIASKMAAKFPGIFASDQYASPVNFGDAPEACDEEKQVCL